MAVNLFPKKIRTWVLMASVGVVLLAVLAPALDSAQSADLILDGGSTFTMPPPDSITYDSEIIGDSGQGTLNQTGGTNVVTGTGFFDFVLGNESTGSGTYNLSGGILSVRNEIIGRDGTGTFTQTGGTNTVNGDGEYTGFFAVGYEPGGHGTYSQSGGTTIAIALGLSLFPGSRGTYSQSAGSLSTGLEFIGSDDYGTFTQSGGTHTVNGFVLSGEPFGLVLGRSSDGTGTYDLSGTGSLTVGVELTVGDDGTGVFNQTGGTNTVTNSLVLAKQTGSSGTYNLEAGRLSAGTIRVNQNGIFTQTGGTNLVTEDLITMNGAYELTGTGSLQATNALITTGIFTQTGGTHTVTDSLTLALTSGSSGSYELSAGSLSAASEIIGELGTGRFTQTGGNHTVTGDLSLGLAFGSSGIYELSSSGGLQASNVNIGLSGTGAFTQTGGIHTVTNDLILGGSPYSEGTYTQSGGTHTVANNLFLGFFSGSSGTYGLHSSGSLSAEDEIIGRSGVGTFTQTGGTHTVTNLVLANNTGSHGTYNLKGGTLSAGTIQVNSGGAFNATGGTHTVTGNVTNAGTVKTTNADVTWAGTFTNNGVYTSDPSTQTFSDLVVGSTGYLVAASQDVFIVTDDFINQSTQNTLFNTVAAELQFATGVDTSHDLYIPGADLGATFAGYTDNFAWHTLDITGQTMNLFDGSGTDGGALYVEVILGAVLASGAVTNIVGATEVLNIYYNPFLPENAYLGGLEYAFSSGSGQLIPTPLPASVLLLGTGLLGLGLLGRRRRKS